MGISLADLGWKEQREEAARRIQKSYRNYLFVREIRAFGRKARAGDRHHGLFGAGLRSRAALAASGAVKRTGKELWAKLRVRC